ncbi:photoactive yellow protein [Noviherbaspirillum pedocola]|uniref:photoactive yellow protein n=1 Tax=Noviherbaspirillum pedocola TaxID=2801341 RepID=UPI002D7E98EA|nr:photoactive yellow protein [Noviherbaspirillum pedocola]
MSWTNRWYDLIALEKYLSRAGKPTRVSASGIQNNFQGVRMNTMDLIAFGKADIDNVLAKMKTGDIDKLAFGAVELDKNGTVLKYNAAEGAITGRDPKSVIGKNFFRDVAPCTSKPAFKGVFDAGVRANDLNSLFEYVFDYQMKPTKVKVHMKKALSGDTFWIFVKRI